MANTFDATNDYWLDETYERHVQSINRATDKDILRAQAAIEHRAGRHEPSERNRFNDMLKTAPAPVEETV